MGDYIEREKLIEHLRKDPLFELVERYGITGVIESIPAADVRPVVRGKWVYQGQLVIAEEYPTYKCSNCGKKIPADWRKNCNFCPNCGADIRPTSINDAIEEGE